MIYDNIIVDSYSKLTKVELNRFTQFVESPYFNKHIPTKKLHQYLAGLFPDFDQDYLAKDKIYNFLFKGKRFNASKLKDVNFQLLKLLERFLINENLRENNLESNRLLLQKCKEKGLDKLQKKRIKDGLKMIGSENLDYNINVYYSYVFHDFAYEFEELKGDRIKSNKHLQQRADFLDKFYFTEKMIQGAVMLNQQNQIQSQLVLNFYDDFLNIIEDKSDFFVEENVILVNKHLYQLQKNESEEEYRIIKDIIYTKEFTLSEKRTYYTFLRNFCTISLNKGNSTFLKELFEMNNKIIEEKILLYNNQLSEWTYKNFIAVGLRLKEFLWTYDFIHNYSKYLSDSISENAESYNYANLHYAQNNYNEALSYLLQTEFSDLIYALSSKALLLKIYYETNELDALESLLHSFRLYVIRQKKIALKTKEVYLSLIKITEALLKFKQSEVTYTLSKRKITLHKIRSKIEKAASLANKTWLLEKVSELE